MSMAPSSGRFPLGASGPAPRDLRREAIAREVAGPIDWLPVLLFASMLMSPEARIDVGGLALFPYRLALLLSVPFLVQRVTKEPFLPTAADFCMVASGVWMFLATAVHYGFAKGLESGGALAFDFVAAYMAGRICFRNPLDVRRFLYAVTPLVVVIGLVIFVESISHRYIFRPFVGAISGWSPTFILNDIYEIRLGLLRATGPFLHPIGGGLFMGSLLPLYFWADLPKRRWLGIGGAIGGLFTLSSAAITSFFFGAALSAYRHILRPAGIGWMPLVAVILIACLSIQVLSETGFVRFVIRNAALDPATGYFRIAIWDYGWMNVARSPVFGIGLFESYERPAWMGTDSVDNLWLSHALRFGVPCMVFLIAGLLLNFLFLVSTSKPTEPESLTGRPAYVGVAMSTFISFLLTITVAPWGAEFAWFTMLAGMVGGLAKPLEITRSRRRYDPITA